MFPNNFQQNVVKMIRIYDVYINTLLIMLIINKHNMQQKLHKIQLLSAQGMAYDLRSKTVLLNLNNIGLIYNNLGIMGDQIFQTVNQEEFSQQLNKLNPHIFRPLLHYLQNNKLYYNPMINDFLKVFYTLQEIYLRSHDLNTYRRIQTFINFIQTPYNLTFLKPNLKQVIIPYHLNQEKTDFIKNSYLSLQRYWLSFRYYLIKYSSQIFEDLIEYYDIDSEIETGLPSEQESARMEMIEMSQNLDETVGKKLDNEIPTAQQSQQLH